MTYADFGVDIHKIEAIDDKIKALVQSTYNSHASSHHGLFGGKIDLRAFASPLYLKAKICGASENVNPEAMVQSVFKKMGHIHQPLAFLDYIAANHLSQNEILSFIRSYAKSLNADFKVPLIGGETADMPGIFQENQKETVGVCYYRSTEGIQIDVTKTPFLILSVDGVGTKTKLALQHQKLLPLIDDIVHHSLGDILCMKAKGVGFTLFVGAHGRETLPQDFETVAREKVMRTGLELMDFHVSIDPQKYAPGEVDIVGSIAGLASEEESPELLEGDVLIALPSNGPHTNGYTAIRQLDDHTPFIDQILMPHRNYAPLVWPHIEKCKRIAHITGGGIPGNLIRILPENLSAVINKKSWEVPPLFQWLQDKLKMPTSDPIKKGMFETFNMGVGLIIAADQKDKDDLLKALEGSFEIGSLKKSEEKNVILL